MSIYVDSGGFSSNFANPVPVENVVTYPYGFPNNGGTREYVFKFKQYANTIIDYAWGSTYAFAPSAYLSGRGPVTPIGAGLVEFTLSYSEIPASWSEKQIVAYTFPGLSGTLTTGWSAYAFRAAITLYCVANVSHSYTESTTAPTPAAPFIVTDNGNVVDYIGQSNPELGVGLTSPSIEPISYVVSGSVALIRPTIWENVTITVPKP